MVWALLAAFLRNRPPWAQAVMFGMCTGLFVAASALGVQRIVHIGSATILVLVVAAFTGGAFYFALRAHLRSRSTARDRAVWVHIAYAAVWLFALSAAVRALLGAGGLRVAVLAIVPIVLLAPPALFGLRALSGRRTEPASSSAGDGTSCRPGWLVALGTTGASRRREIRRRRD
jgi:cytochrome bd-type quinol oxidase subunit 2